jgi:SAM-dependent methyltransferase
MAAAQAGVSQRARFDVAPAKDFPGQGYDLVCLFDALHDMGDPAGVARRIRQALAPDGTLLLVEPNAGNAPEHNLNPVGRTYTACPRSSARQGRWRRKSGWDSERRPVNAS